MKASKEQIEVMQAALDEKKQKANAAFIVKAVNNHEKLLGALKELIASPEIAGDGVTDDTAAIQAKVKALEAIKEAE